MKKKQKFIIAFDTICEGWQTGNDDEGKPPLYDSEQEAFMELFSDALSMLEGYSPAERREVDVSAKLFKEMKALYKEKDYEKMKKFLDENGECNVNDEFIVPEEEYIPNRKTIYTGQ
jgi:hypothetical protein